MRRETEKSLKETHAMLEEGITIHIRLGPEIKALLPVIKQLFEDTVFPVNDVVREPDEILTPDDLAAIWKVPKSKIYALTMKTGPDSIPRFKIGRHLRFKRSIIEKWADEQKIK